MAQVRAIKGFENLSDEEVLDILNSLKRLAALTFQEPLTDCEDEKRP